MSCTGKVYWELRVVEATGFACIGLVGTSFLSGPQTGEEAIMGMDEASWGLAVRVDVSKIRSLHGCPPARNARNRQNTQKAKDCGVDQFLREGATVCVA